MNLIHARCPDTPAMAGADSQRLFTCALPGAGHGNDMDGVVVRRGADGFDGAHLAGRHGFDGDAIVAAIGQADAGENEIAVLFDRDIVGSVELQPQSFACKPGDLAAYGIAVGGARNGDVVDCRAGDAAATLADRASLFYWRGGRCLDGDSVSVAFV